MNSVYGFTGAQKGILPLVDIASSVTMKGRSMIQETKEYIEKNFPGAHVRYGDSVMPDTPVLVRRNGDVMTQTIESLGEVWVDYPGFLKDGTQKEQCDMSDIEAWTPLG
jgi:DNA polymerase elongation subunit (family B)